MTKQIKKLEGSSIHCHHDKLVEYCYNYKARVEYIKSDKPRQEQKIRLKLFKLLPPEALKDIPKKYQETDAKRREACAKWREADDKWQETDARWQEAYAKRREACAKWREADKEWSQKDKDDFHKKWCGCSYWKNNQLVFEEYVKTKI